MKRDYVEYRSTACQAGSDGDCVWRKCPQHMDGEPGKSGRDCPLLKKPPTKDKITRSPSGRTPVIQDWVCQLPFMQQSVLLASLRGPDGVDKSHPSKALCKWLRRSIVISAFDRKALLDPCHPGGGSYTGPSLEPVGSWEEGMDGVTKKFLDSVDSLPHHFVMHFIHAAEIIGYKHCDTRVRRWWRKTYLRFCHDLHMHPETMEELDNRLDDCEEKWRADATRFKK